MPDALSRMYEEEDLEVSASTWASDTNDAWYLQWLEVVTRGRRAHPRWKVVAGQLYFFAADETIDAAIGDDDAWKLVVPRERRRDVLRESHDDPTAGHARREKTHERVARLYFWPNLYKQRCQVCQQTKAEQRPPAGLMGQRVVERPWQVVAGDITGPFVRSTSGYEYILVF